MLISNYKTLQGYPINSLMNITVHSRNVPRSAVEKSRSCQGQAVDGEPVSRHNVKQ